MSPFNSLHRATLFIAALASILAACADNSVTPTGTVPSIGEMRVEANPNNVVSARVIVQAANASQVLVEYGTDTAFASHTPSVAATTGSTVIPVVGLLANTTYNMRVVATATGGARATSLALTFTTGALPTDMVKYTVTPGSNPAPGYVMFGITSGNLSLGGFYATAVDNAGRVVWYRKFDSQITDFQKQPNGHYTVYASLGAGARHFYELDRMGDVVGEYNAEGGNETGAHELRLTPNGYMIFGIVYDTVDLSASLGSATARVMGMSVEYHRGADVFRWNTFDHLTLDEAASDISLATPNIDPWHLNAVEIDTDDNLLISFRNSDEIVKVDSKTGAILWRLGGSKNQFTFTGDPLGGFSHQHGVRRLPNGHIIMFDNGNLHIPALSRAVEYSLDESARAAHMVWEYRSDPAIFSFALGFAQRLSAGGTLICYGASGRVIEVDAAGNKQWQLALESPAYLIYRAFRIESLY